MTAGAYYHLSSVHCQLPLQF